MAKRCCDPNCFPCPSDPNETGYYSTDHPTECCGCMVDILGCGHPDTGGPGRPDRKGKCDCHCDSTKRRQDCLPSEPDFDIDKCECYCARVRSDTDSDGNYTDSCLGRTNPPGMEEMNHAQCRCECVASFDCKAVDPSKPKYVRRSFNFCFCECDKNASDCTDPKKPEFDSDNCECYCSKQRLIDAGQNPCPDPKRPTYDPSECKCECNQLILLQECNNTPAKPNPDYDKCECECRQASPEYCATLDTNGATSPEQYNYVFDPATCSCKCGLESDADCSGNRKKSSVSCYCYCPSDDVKKTCTDDEKFDSALCKCVPKDYSQSLLNSLLLP